MLCARRHGQRKLRLPRHRRREVRPPTTHDPARPPSRSARLARHRNRTPPGPHPPAGIVVPDIAVLVETSSSTSHRSRTRFLSRSTARPPTANQRGRRGVGHGAARPLDGRAGCPVARASPSPATGHQRRSTAISYAAWPMRWRPLTSRSSTPGGSCWPADARVVGAAHLHPSDPLASRRAVHEPDRRPHTASRPCTAEAGGWPSSFRCRCGPRVC